MPDVAAPLLDVRGLVAGYGGTPILRGVDLVVGVGEVVAVLGANGVGKTTLNKALSGVVATDTGEIKFTGRRIDGLPAAEIVAMGLVQVPEGRRIFPNLSVRENLELGSYRRARAGRARNLERVLGIFPRLKERAAQRAGTLSGGEPSLGLSPMLVEEMFTLIRTLNAEGLAVLLVEQNVMQSLELASRAYVLENGQVVMAGDAKVLAADPALEKAYLGM